MLSIPQRSSYTGRRWVRGRSRLYPSSSNRHTLFIDALHHKDTTSAVVSTKESKQRKIAYISAAAHDNKYIIFLCFSSFRVTILHKCIYFFFKKEGGNEKELGGAARRIRAFAHYEEEWVT
jgi:hypothetical protein